MEKQIKIMLASFFLLITFTLLLISLNESNLITSFVIKDVDLSMMNKISITASESDVIKVLYGAHDYSYQVMDILDRFPTYNINSKDFGLTSGDSVNIDLNSDNIADTTITIDTFIDGKITMTFEAITCNPNWYCESFSECVNGVEKRNCYDLSKCANPSFLPQQSRVCVGSCADHIKNQYEEGVDCGGTCKPCLAPEISVYVWAAIPITIAVLSILIGTMISKLRKKYKKRFTSFKTKEFRHVNPQVKEPHNNFYTSQISKKLEPVNIGMVSESAEDPLKALRGYIEMALVKGYTVQVIKTRLLEKGWDQKVVDDNIDFVIGKFSRRKTL